MSYFSELPQVDQDTITAAIDAVLTRGDAVSVYDGGEITVRASTDRATIIAALCTSDEDRLYFHRDGSAKHSGWAWLVYGNEPGVVIADATANEYTDSILARSNEIMMEYEG